MFAMDHSNVSFVSLGDGLVASTRQVAFDGRLACRAIRPASCRVAPVSPRGGDGKGARRRSWVGQGVRSARYGSTGARRSVSHALHTARRAAAATPTRRSQDGTSRSVRRQRRPHSKGNPTRCSTRWQTSRRSSRNTTAPALPSTCRRDEWSWMLRRQAAVRHGRWVSL